MITKEQAEERVGRIKEVIRACQSLSDQVENWQTDDKYWEEYQNIKEHVELLLQKNRQFLNQLQRSLRSFESAHVTKLLRNGIQEIDEIINHFQIEKVESIRVLTVANHEQLQALYRQLREAWSVESLVMLHGSSLSSDSSSRQHESESIISTSSSSHDSGINSNPLSDPNYLSNIKIHLRGLIILRDRFEKIALCAIPKKIDGQRKPHYENLLTLVFNVSKSVSSALRQLYDTLDAIKNSHEPELYATLEKIRTEQQEKLSGKVGLLKKALDESQKNSILNQKKQWDDYCYRFSNILIDFNLAIEDYERYQLERSCLKKQLKSFQEKAKNIVVEKPSCFISYSWGFSWHTKRVHELAKFLSIAGIDVKLDIWHNKIGSIPVFLDYIEQVNFILVMGSEDLVEKWKYRSTSGESRDRINGEERRYKGHVVADELGRIETIMRDTPEKKRNVFPVLLSGNNQTSLTLAFREIATSALSLTDSSAFKNVVFNLLELMYQEHPKIIKYLNEYKDKILSNMHNENIRKEESGVADKNFIDLYNSKFFVNKASFIVNFLNDDSKVILITRPRRFGKTSNLSMLYHFFSERIVNEENKTKSIFQKLLGIKNRSIIQNHHGKHVVINLTFKDISFNDEEQLVSKFLELMSKTYQSFTYLVINGTMASSHYGDDNYKK